MPVEGQDWTSDPFRMVERDGKFYGRGSADMKGFIASCLAMAPAALKRELTIPIHFAFSYDEEVGCLGVQAIDQHAEGCRAAAAHGDHRRADLDAGGDRA